MYVIFLQCTHCVEKTLIFSCTLLCESGDRVKCDQSSLSAYLHAVMLRHHCSEYGNSEDTETVQSTPVSSYFTTKHRAKYAQIICAVEER